MWQVYAERADVIPWPNSNKSKNKAKGQRKNRKTKKK
jgi:hypothetical protein